MRLFARPSSVEAAPKPQRSLVLHLLAVLLFQVCVLMGVLASPFFRVWKPRPVVRMSDPAALTVRWRRSLARRADDPRVGAQAPPLRLRTETGQPFRLTDLKGKKVVLIFDTGGST